VPERTPFLLSPSGDSSVDLLRESARTVTVTHRSSIRKACQTIARSADISFCAARFIPEEAPG